MRTGEIPSAGSRRFPRTAEDAWPLEPFTFTPGNNLAPVTVMGYAAAGAGAAMYQNPGEACIASPAVANDVVLAARAGSAQADSVKW